MFVQTSIKLYFIIRKGFISKHSFHLAKNNLFLPKEKADSFLQDRSGRVKRDIDEECRETDGCWIEEILEYGVTDVVTILFKYVLLRVLSNFLEDWISGMRDLKGDGKT